MYAHILTVRDERAYTVTHVSPFDSNFVNLRKFKHVLALGAATDPWVEPAASADSAMSRPTPVRSS